MNLPAPSVRIAGCVWLPRILAKARLLARGELPPEYAARFCHASGVDGQFLAHFGLRRDDVVAAARLPEPELERWLLSRPGVTRASVEAWNHLAMNLGRPGFPMAERLPRALATTYRHLAGHKFSTVFEVLAADETASPSA